MNKLITMLILVMSISLNAQWITPDPSTLGFQSICFAGNNLFAGVENNIKKSTNYGNNWTQSYTVGFPIEHIIYTSENRIFAGGEYGVRASTDQGATWVKNQPWPDSGVAGLVSIPNGHVFAAGRGFYRMYNFNSGWNRMLNVNLLKMFKTNDTTIICISGFKVYKTTDEGYNWDSISIPYFNPRSFTVLNDVWYAGLSFNNYHGIWKSTNNGQNWTRPGGLTNPNHLCLAITTAGNILVTSTRVAIGPGSGIFVSSDGGDTWISVFEDFGGTDLMSGNDYVYAINSDIELYRNTITNLISVEQISTVLPKGFQLNQNYPNPFNPSTTITFDVAKVQKIRLSVYDVLGKEVAVLVDEQLKPGTYETKWNASGVASGVYFYKLTAGDYSETKQMILLK